MAMKNLFWDIENQSIRGSFVNLILTLTILGMIVAGITSDAAAARVEKLSTLILGFFATSIGVWTYKKIAEGKQAGTDEQIRQQGEQPCPPTYIQQPPSTTGGQ
jgi:TRAP-type mannitol/chloroaromatic compound transport system permease large subunit